MKAMLGITAVVFTVFMLFFYGVGDEASEARPMGAVQASPDSESLPGVCTGPVLETMSSGGYTYVRVDCRSGELWAAGPETAVSVGDEVSLPHGQQMQDFYSPTLERTFETILFVPGIQPAGGGRARAPMPLEAAHQGLGDTAGQGEVDLSGIDKPAGALSVAEIFEDRAKLAGREVMVLGKVVKYNAMILGKNWLHVRDGTGGPGSNDLTITTQETASVGDTVLVRGTVGLDRDIGAGYRYDVLLENATITIQ